MKSLSFLPLLLLLAGSLSIHGQITSNVWERLLFVRVGAGTSHVETATAFTLEVDNRQYLITAKHVVASLLADDSIEYAKAGKWVRLPVHVFRCDDPTDIAVLVAPHQLTTAFPFEADLSQISYGQDVHFLGFPYGISLNGTNVNGDFPLPFVKRATYSGTVTLDAGKHSVLALLDGYNNPGFSGGPIVYRDPFGHSWDYKLMGVVSGFQPDLTPTMARHPIKSRDEASENSKEQPWRIQTDADGKMFEYVETGTYVALNTGIIRGFVIFPALDVIKKHPIGPVVNASETAVPTRNSPDR